MTLPDKGDFARKWLGGMCFVIGAAATPFVVLVLSAMANRVQAPVAVDYDRAPAAAQDQTCSAREAPQEDSISLRPPWLIVYDHGLLVGWTRLVMR